jgi:hypothetical protein
MRDEDTLYECPICHLDNTRDNMVKGICIDCHESFETAERYTVKYERTHGNEYDWSDFGY